jgi:hypothetical protein
MTYLPFKVNALASNSRDRSINGHVAIYCLITHWPLHVIKSLFLLFLLSYIECEKIGKDILKVRVMHTLEVFLLFEKYNQRL